jgi:hypothetical protein
MSNTDEYLLLNNLLDSIDATLEEGRNLARKDEHGRNLTNAMLNLRHVRVWTSGILNDVVEDMAKEQERG